MRTKIVKCWARDAVNIGNIWDAVHDLFMEFLNIALANSIPSFLKNAKTTGRFVGNSVD